MPKTFPSYVVNSVIPEEPMLPSEWAKKFRTLTRKQSARPGRWHHENSPATVGIMDACAHEGVEEINLVKAAQMGGSEAIRNVIGYYAHQEPDPVLLVLPNEQFGRRIMGRRIIPLFNDTPSLRKLVSDRATDTQLSQIALLNGFVLSLGWSGSPATLAADPARIVINDEVDKFTEWVGRESDPISLGYVRTQTFEDSRLIINLSTPTTSAGLICQRFEGSPIKLYPRFACPLCGTYQRIQFPQIKWNAPDESDPDNAAAHIEHQKDVWYECENCKKHIEDGQPRHDMLQTCVWASDDQVVRKDGQIRGDWPVGKRVGMHIWSAHATWIKWWQIAAEFVRSKGDPIRMQNFRNSWLGEPFEEQIAAPKRSTFSVKRDSSKHNENVVPSWSGALIASADVQKDHFWYVVRAWGSDFRSQLVRYGTVRTFDELRAVTLDQAYQIDTIEANYGSASPSLLVIDSGDRTDEVYQFALTDPDRIIPTKGASQQQRSPISYRRISYQPAGRSAIQVMLHMVDTNFYKDRLARFIGEEENGEEKWLLNTSVDDEYCHQMASEHKVMVRSRTGPRVDWRPVSSGIANHIWDTEVLNVVGADIANVGLLPDEGTIRKARQSSPQPKADSQWRPNDSGGNWATSYKKKW